MTLIRTRTQGCYRLRQNRFGSFLSVTSDPLGEHEITKDQLQSFELFDDYPKIPYVLWQAWLSLCMDVCDGVKTHGVIDGGSEVCCRFLINDAGEWRIIIPRQTVGSGSVRASDFNDSVDLMTGEPVETYPPEGWYPAGSSHSHNTMSAFWSTIDDSSEIPDPGVHITVGSIDTKRRQYDYCWSITANHTRYKFKWREDQHIIADPLTENPELPGFHKNCLKYIKNEDNYSYISSGLTKWSTNTSGQIQRYDSSFGMWGKRKPPQHQEGDQDYLTALAECSSAADAIGDYIATLGQTEAFEALKEFLELIETRAQETEDFLRYDTTAVLEQSTDTFSYDDSNFNSDPFYWDDSPQSTVLRD